MNKRNMDFEAWICLIALIFLFAAYFVPLPILAVRVIGAVVALVFGVFGALYVRGDDKGRDWRGSFLPFAMGLSGLRLLLP
uniref:Uncharacterized protein n=1 Tax=viral metagenome TaxID=1070528 RepID=A0A6H1ZJ03_9ZZZZ